MKIDSSFLDILSILNWIFIQWIISPILLYYSYNLNFKEAGIESIFPLKTKYRSDITLHKKLLNVTLFQKNYAFFYLFYSLLNGIFIISLYEDTNTQLISLMVLKLLHMFYIVLVVPFTNDAPFLNLRNCSQLFFQLMYQLYIYSQANMLDEGSKHQIDFSDLSILIIFATISLYCYLSIFSWLR